MRFMSARLGSVLVLAVLVATPSSTLHAQSGRMTAAEYDRAVNLLGPNLTGLMIGGTVTASWLPDGRFWYRAQTATGAEFRLVNPAAKRMAPAFNHERLSSALGSASGTSVNATQLPFQQITFNAKLDSVSFDVGERRFRCDVAATSCVSAGSAIGGKGQKTEGAVIGGAIGAAGGWLAGDQVDKNNDKHDESAERARARARARDRYDDRYDDYDRF